MKISADKKQTVILYLLEKIAQGSKSVSRDVAETFGISPNTVHTYLNELQKNNIITKRKRGEYALVATTEFYSFSRSRGELSSDTVPYERCLSKKIGHLPENVKHIWAYAVSEMVNNVIDHSHAENMDVTVMQDYLFTTVIIVDDGVGIFEKIRQYFHLASLDEAICELFKGKLTTDQENHSGEGIFFTSRMMDMFFISSSAKVFSTTKYSNEQVSDLADASDGTCVWMSLSNFTKRQAKEVFDSFSNTEGSFATTRIPLNSIFDSAPVSRSQAKRLCFRLDCFEEVILDFDGISWIGQGFAHQIFVVYQNAHPAVKLVPINMNDGVASMYRHVMNSN